MMASFVYSENAMRSRMRMMGLVLNQSSDILE
jgi:hypothetical protein